jgi:hypothetical protein
MDCYENKNLVLFPPRRVSLMIFVTCAFIDPFIWHFLPTGFDYLLCKDGRSNTIKKNNV